MNLINGILAVFWAVLKAQLVLSPLLIYHRFLVIRKNVAVGFLWQIQKSILLSLVLLVLFFSGSHWFGRDALIGGEAAACSSGLITGVGPKNSFRTDATVAAETTAREAADVYRTGGLIGNITALLRVAVDILFCLSLGGFAWFLIRLCGQLAAEQGLRKRASVIRCLKRVQVIYSRELLTAFTAGIFKKRIFLPYEHTRDRMLHKAVLMHELNHIRKSDLVWLFMESLLSYCFWYSWFARQLMFCGMQLRELRCDHATASRFKENTYLQILLNSGAGQLKTAGMEFLANNWISKRSRGFFTRRVKYLLTTGNRPGMKIKAFLACLVACCLVLSLGAEKTPGPVQPENRFAAEPVQTLPGDELDIPVAGSDISQPHIANALLWPLPGDGGKITSGFGPRESPFGEKFNYHNGMDIAARRGTPVLAIADGTVRETGYKPEGPGRFLLIAHGNGLTSFYGQLNEILVKEGDTVHRGDVIGKLGSSGISTGPHLHLEIRYLDEALDPQQLLKSGQNTTCKE